MKPNLIGVDLKLRRAEEHLDFLDAERKRVLAIHDNRVVGQFDAEASKYVLRADGPAPPDEWGIRVSEFANALRSSLDNLLWQLILARGGTPVANVTQFPINEKESQFNGEPKRKPRPGQGPWPTEADRLTFGIHDKDRAFIESAQPFQLAERAKWHPLALLGHLNNVDKHRYMHPAFAAAAVPQASGATGIARFRDGLTIVVAEDGHTVEIRPVLYAAGVDINKMIGPWPTLFNAEGGIVGIVGFAPSDDRTEIAHVAGIDEPAAGVQVNPPLTLEISLSERERPMTIFDFRDILQEVRRIVERFRPAIVKP